MDKGVLYIASGSSYIDEAKKSAKSVKDNTDLPVTLVADRDVSDSCFDSVIQLNDFVYHYGDSVLQIPDLPYDNTVLLDTDTIVADDFGELFSLMSRFDIAVSTIAESKFEIPEKVPAALPEYNTGVVLFNNNQRTSEFIDTWKDIYRRYLDENVRMNQPAFREAVFQSPVQIVTVPTEYNCRANFGGFLREKVKILHGSFENTDRMIEKINEFTTPRVYYNKDGDLHVERVNTTNNRFSD